METVYTWGAPPLVFGAGALDETGAHVAALGLRRVALVTDQGLVATGLPARVEASLTAAGVGSVCFDRVHVEPTDASMLEAAEWARSTAGLDGFVARRRRLVDRHRQGDEPALDQRRRRSRTTSTSRSGGRWRRRGR